MNHIFATTRLRTYLGLALLVLLAGGCRAQWGYETYSKTNGLEISTKWGKAKDADNQRREALLLRIENMNDYPVEFSIDVNFYYEGVLRETGGVENACIGALSTRMGRLNGVYFIPEKFTSEQLKAPDFAYTLEDVTVNRTEPCEGGLLTPSGEGE